MKYLKNFIISSDGSLNFSSNITKNNKKVIFYMHDDKNCRFYIKVKKTTIDSKHLTSYRKKYLK